MLNESYQYPGEVLCQTYVKAKTKEEKKKEEFNALDLAWSKMLRTIAIPRKINQKSEWTKLSSDACKIYILLWALSSVKPRKAYNGYKLNEKVSFKKLLKHSGMDQITFTNAAKELQKKKLLEYYASEEFQLSYEDMTEYLVTQ